MRKPQTGWRSRPASAEGVAGMSQTRSCDKGPRTTRERVMLRTRNKNLYDELFYAVGRHKQIVGHRVFLGDVSDVGRMDPG